MGLWAAILLSGYVAVKNDKARVGPFIHPADSCGLMEGPNRALSLPTLNFSRCCHTGLSARLSEQTRLMHPNAAAILFRGPQHGGCHGGTRHGAVLEQGAAQQRAHHC